MMLQQQILESWADEMCNLLDGVLRETRPMFVLVEKAVLHYLSDGPKSFTEIQSALDMPDYSLKPVLAGLCERKALDVYQRHGTKFFKKA
jgi:hypothetical protein